MSIPSSPSLSLHFPVLYPASLVVGNNVNVIFLPLLRLEFQKYFFLFLRLAYNARNVFEAFASGSCLAANL